tara:strand:- start:2775 stop:4187 length:1413 start_codon:yes stop_codon:yes gene_type:complete
MYDILIIGSGLSSTAFLQGFAKKNKKIGLISPSFLKVKRKTITSRLKTNYFKNLPPRVNEKNINGYINYLLKNKLQLANNVSIFGDLSHGGVSNYWGGSCDFLDESQITFLNNENKKKLLNYYTKIFKENNFYGNLNIFKKQTNKKNFTDKNLNKVFQNLIFDNTSNKIKFYTNTNAKNTKTGKLYLPLNINTLTKNIKKLNYFVKKIEKKKNYYSVTCCDNKKSIEIFTKKLVLGTGTISTTKLICEMLKINKPINIDHNPMLLGLFILKEKIKLDSENFAPSKLASKIYKNDHQTESVANFRTSNVSIKSKIFDNFKIMKNPLSKGFYNIIEKNLLFFNLYLDSKYGDLNIQLQKNNTLRIFYKKKNIDKIKNILKNDAKTIYNYLKSKNLVFPLKVYSLPPWGNDNHFTGTIPINGTNKQLSLKENCELKGFKNLFIIDGSSIPTTTLKFPTALIISNAYRIGKEFK